MTPWVAPHSTGLATIVTSFMSIKVFSVSKAEQALLHGCVGGGGGGGGQQAICLVARNKLLWNFHMY